MSAKEKYNYIKEKIKLISDFDIDLTDGQVLKMFTLNTEIAIDNFVQHIINCNSNPEVIHTVWCGDSNI